MRSRCRVVAARRNSATQCPEALRAQPWRPLESAPTVIRLANSSDVGDIARLHVKAWQSAYRGHMPDAYLDALEPFQRVALWSKAIAQPGTFVLAAEEQRAIVGFCSLLPSRDADASPAVAEITAIYVDPARVRSGVGSSLIEAALEIARTKSFVEVTLWVLTGNLSARAFYEARGFEPDGTTKTEQRPGFSIHEIRYRRQS